MEIRAVIRVLEDFRLSPDTDGNIALLSAGIDPQYIQQAIDYFISLAKDYEQAKVGLPERKEETYKQPWLKGDTRYTRYDAAFNACLHQVALSRVKLKKKIIKHLKNLEDEGDIRIYSGITWKSIIDMHL